MNETILKLYHALPPSTRSIVASGRGAYLRFWRYDRITEELAAEAIERESWSPKDWSRWREERLAHILHRAATKVPFYRAMWEQRRRNGDRASWQYLENWPILEKSAVRENPEAFLADGCSTWRMFAEHTSGTTAKPITLWRSRKVQRAWYALLEARTRHWYDISRHDRWGIFGGQLIVPVNNRKPPFWTWNAALRQLYLSSFHLAPDLVGYYLDALVKYKVKSLLGYSSALFFIAQHALRLERRDVKMSVVVTNAEPLSKLQRRVISQAFQCPVRETYGSAEIVAAASECNDGHMHQWPEVGLLESLGGALQVPDGVPDELICTSLLNDDMPLVRYRMGDCASLDQDEMPCSCGRRLPRIGNVEGRVDDVLYTTDGRRIGRLDPAFKGNMPLVEAQVIQECLDRIRVLCVPAPGFSVNTKLAIERTMRAYLGPVKVIVEEVGQVPREKNGKFRAVICRVPPQMRRLIPPQTGSPRIEETGAVV